MKVALVLCLVYGLFLLWHRRWFTRPLSRDEIALRLETQRDSNHGAISAQERENLVSFLKADDGKPFYMINLMEYREKALYRDGQHPDVKTGRQANTLYSRVVIRELIKRGSYPLFVSRRIGSFLTAGVDTDFFEEVGIIRYRSRRDLLDMATSPNLVRAGAHKWASLEKTVVVPTRRIVSLDLGIVVPLLLALLGLVFSGL